MRKKSTGIAMIPRPAGAAGGMPSLAAALALFAGSAASAGTPASWTNGQGTNNWGDGMNWSGGTAPFGDYDVTIGAPTSTILDVSPSIGTLDVTAAGELIIRSAQTLTLTKGVLNNAGLISLNPEGGSSQARLQLPAVDLDLTGGGRIVLNSTSSAEIVGDALFRISADSTVSGSGTLNAILINSGLVAADQTGGTLNIVKPLGNSGTLKATNGGVLEITGAAAGGQIVADGGTVGLGNGGSITSATLSTANSGQFLTNGSDFMLDNVTNNGAFVIQNGSKVRLLSNNPFVNNGQMTISGTPGSTAELNSPFDKTISGTGTITLLSPTSRITTNNAILTQSAGHTIRGSGWIDTILFNDGTVVADNNSVPLTASKSVANYATGVLRAVNGATLTVHDGNNFGAIEVGGGSTFAHDTALTNYGAIRLGFDGGAGTLHVPGGLTLAAGGTLSGSGTVTSGGVLTIENSGTISPGFSAGRLDVEGSLNLSSTSLIVLEIGGTAPGVESDLITATGGVMVFGKLELRLINGFTPAADDVFTVMTAGGIGGDFINTHDGQRLDITGDYGSFLVSYGNGQGTMTLSQFAVPEPSVALLLLSGLCAPLIRRRRA